MSSFSATFGNGGGITKAKVSVKFEEWRFHITGCVLLNLKLALQVVSDQTKRNVSISSRSSGPSKPGEFPHANTGRLRNSIFWSVDEKLLTGIVGTPLMYGVWLEYGTTGGKVINPTSKRFLSWINPATGARVFARQVTTKPMAPRSFLRRTLLEMRSTVQSIMTRKIPDKNLSVSLG